jgi:hypothetical protein
MFRYWLHCDIGGTRLMREVIDVVVNAVMSGNFTIVHKQLIAAAKRCNCIVKFRGTLMRIHGRKTCPCWTARQYFLNHRHSRLDECCE